MTARHAAPSAEPSAAHGAGAAAAEAREKAPGAFRTISEVAEELDIPAHVLRFWESKFAQLSPMKRGGGRRYYRPADVALLRGIRVMLYGEGLTIKGLQKVFRERGLRHVVAVGEGVEAAVAVDEDAADAPDTPAAPATAPQAAPAADAAPDAAPDAGRARLQARLRAVIAALERARDGLRA